MKNFTDMTILLDRSGSMATIKTAMESALDELFIQHKQIPATRVTLVQFDSEDPYDVVFENRLISSVPKVTLEPRGWTPLCDALCESIDQTGRRLKRLDPSNRPSKVLFIVITDGAENSSRKHNRADVKDRITKQSDVYNWEFVYLGANQDAIAEATTLGIRAGSTMTFGYNTIDTQNAMRSVMANTLSYSGGAAGAAMASFSDDDRENAVKQEKNNG